MKKVLPGLVLLSLLALPVIGLAQGETPPGDQPKLTTIVKTGAELIGLINNIGNWIFVILMALAAVFLIVSGILFVTASGKPENIDKARHMLINALIGVAVALGAKGLVAVLGSILGTGK